jgi:Tfp pilus assembly protein PilO
MSLRDPQTQRLVATGIVCGAAAWLYFFAGFVPFGYRAHAKKAAELRARQETLSTELEKARRTVGNLPQLEREQTELETKWKQAEALLPTSKEMPELLSQMTQSGDQSGVEFTLFKPDASRPQEFYNENPVHVEVKGGFHQVGVFLSHLANLSRIVNVSDLHLDGIEQKAKQKGDHSAAKPADDGERTDHTLTASFVATAYSLRDPSEPVTPAPAAEKGANRKPASPPRTRAAAVTNSK